MTGGCGAFALIGVLLFVGLVGLIALAALGVLPVQRAWGARYELPRTDPAEEVLRMRLARGEIGAEEFAKASKVLRAEPAYDNYEDFVRYAREQRS